MTSLIDITLCLGAAALFGAMIGFLGAGVIVRDSEGKKVQGLTTGALIWLTACIGIVCGLGAWMVAVVAMGIMFLLLIGGGALENRLHGGRDEDGA